MAGPPDFERAVIYFPTLKKYWGGGGTLDIEYKQGKGLCKGSDIRVTKTPSKVLRYVKEGRTELILVGHGAEAKDEAHAGKVIGGSWYHTPQKDAGDLATAIFRNLGSEGGHIEKVWLWICQSSANGVGVAVRNALRTVAPDTRVYATPADIGGIFFLIDSDMRANVRQDSFVEMR